MYSIKTIAALTGLSTETLRAWERRYQTITPKRDSSGRRSYSDQDLQRLMNLAQLTRNGHSISKLSLLAECDLQQLNQQAKQDISLPQQQLFAQIVEALLDYRIDRCETLLKRALLAYEPLEYARDILAPALQQVGQLWHEGKLGIAQEHMFSAAVKRIILSMVHTLHQVRENSPTMLFATPAGEVHEFGILMICLIAASLHYNCYFLGSDLPLEEVAKASRHLLPDIMVLSVVQSPPSAEIMQQLIDLAADTALSDTHIWVGGAGAMCLDSRGHLPERLQLLTDLDDFHQKAQQMNYILQS